MSILEVELFDVVRLKDGREGAVVEIYRSDRDTGYEIEIAQSAMELVTVSKDEISEIIWKSPK